MTLALHCETAGAGPPLVLWHGWGMNLRCFDALRAALGATHRITAVDLPGHGRSPWSDAWAHGGWLPALTATIPEGATLLGWSLGGQLALRAAATHGSVARLVLICSTPRFQCSEGWPAGVPPDLLLQFLQRLGADPRQVVRDFLELELRGDAEAAAHRGALHAALLAHGEARPEALMAGLSMLESEDLRSLATQVRQPTLIFSGQYDRVTPPAASAALARLMPQARHIDLPRCGHAPLLSASEHWLQPLREFLAAP